MMIAVGGNIYNCISLAVSTFEGEHARARANQLARYGNALNHVCFYTIGQVSQGQFLYLVQNRMLSPDEAEILGEFKGKMTNLLATWMLDTLETASREGTARRIDRATREIILEIRKNAALLQDMQVRKVAVWCGVVWCGWDWTGHGTRTMGAGAAGTLMDVELWV
ncbi:hypothetical protein SARC_08080 [Sphaeroforma arctica JP610]|uniref:Uncharacterized protein n=1 Tax=Sphaeroforma arctica JP610 TaxID=667725 RepID=A0A0L0FRZ0_9EUKA|nr:hypothetical protein SARC_08080 [Sphaeroforma arctica JP610]KNC79525.1 hypothetical protein SARC_08080 [Sphaeroforma arctica JP610]|eukprot:XP_014153427.1 hypothetical protein SARC_08080 [Sphaeroforma arctica JP610]